MPTGDGGERATDTGGRRGANGESGVGAAGESGSGGAAGTTGHVGSGGENDPGGQSNTGAQGGTGGLGGSGAQGGTGGLGGSGAQGGSEVGPIPTNCGTPVSGPAHCDLVTPLGDTRGQHATVLLPSGKVLVVGGFTGVTFSATELATAVLYDPCTDTWSSAGTMHDARASPATALLGDGRVLVVGGAAGGWNVYSAELYDPVTNEWSLTEPPPAPSAVIALPNGKALLIGGEDTAALYDPETEAWSPTGGAVKDRGGYDMTLLASGKVLISGGFSASSAVLDAETYDPSTGTWSLAGTMHRMRNGHAPVRLKSGRVLVSGGYPQAPSPDPARSSEIYDPATNQWSVGADLNVARWIHTATLLHDGTVLLTGGSVGAGAGSATNSAELYDETTGEFSSTVPLNGERWSHTATLLPDGRVLIIGGNDGTNMLSSVQICTPVVP